MNDLQVMSQNQLQGNIQTPIPPSIFKAFEAMRNFDAGGGYCMVDKDNLPRVKLLLERYGKQLAAALCPASPEEAAKHIAFMIGCFPSTQGPHYGAVMLEEVMEDNPSHGAVDLACRAIRRKPAQFAPSIGQVLEEIASQTRTMRWIKQELNRLPGLIAEVEAKQGKQLTGEEKALIQANCVMEQKRQLVSLHAPAHYRP